MRLYYIGAETSNCIFPNIPCFVPTSISPNEYIKQYNINNIRREKKKISQKLKLFKARNQPFTSINKSKLMISISKNKLNTLN